MLGVCVTWPNGHSGVAGSDLTLASQEPRMSRGEMGGGGGVRGGGGGGEQLEDDVNVSLERRR